jgi:branched-chain amino acid transport system ATP-binding protein
MKSIEKEKRLVLQLTSVHKRFGGLVASDDINLEMYSGETLGLIGPNGAGKTTLLNLITGIYTPDSGDTILNGKKITRKPPYQCARLGIARTFQHPRLLNRCDIRTNILMGTDLAAKRKKEKTNVDEEISFLLGCAGMSHINLDDSIEKLSYGQQKLLEIIRSLLTEPEVLLLDEPAAGLNNREMDYIVEMIKVATAKGVAVLLIEHSMDLVMSVCDRITVLNFGHQIATGTPKEIQADKTVINAYLGGDVHA